MPNKNKVQPTRGNTKSNKDIDKALINHLFGPRRSEGIGYLGFLGSDYQKARNRLRYLKTIREEDFDAFIEICNFHDVFPNNNQNARNSTKEEQHSEEPAKKPKATLTTTPISQKKTPSYFPTTSKKFATTPKTSSMSEAQCRHPSADDVEQIYVNINRPEKNREVMIYQLENMKGANDSYSYFHGFAILMMMDIRVFFLDKKTEWYKAWIYSSNSIMLRVPSFVYTLLYNREQVGNVVDDELSNALDNARIDFQENEPYHKWKHLELVFNDANGNPIELSSKSIYNKAGDEEKLKLEMFPVEYTHDQITGMKVEHWIMWKVARLDTSAQKKGKLDNPDESEGWAALQNLLGGNAAMPDGVGSGAL